MRPDEIATQADNKVTRAPDPELDDEVYPLDPPQEAETAVPECEQIDEQAEQNQGQPESWHSFETP
jgi:hypothetical protein